MLALSALTALAACQSEPEPAPEPEPTATSEGPRTLVAAGFNDQELGPKIEGPQGPEVLADLMFEGRSVGSIVSYVACPILEEADLTEGVETEDGELADFSTVCEPDMMPEGTIYTYVHRITPGEDMEGQLLSFRTTREASGFANIIGFDRTQAEAALGEDYAIGVQLDNGELVWRIEAGNGWDAGEEITLFWQSTLPPEGPVEAYEIETAEGRADVTGPFPPEEEPEAEQAATSD
ncbi:hypothetical protein AAW01_02055 [Aurantiacibacter gangjinensis]|uniref:Uncharacterized protein n=1 Tax=Aurantiacibacter gangjinensis TaxID=502682 RepID=A0A0G9MQ20_9SPHN|nr:hypothetical protein AAW01_02055 [Aurantiacibacter gangjinensis]